MNNKLCCVLITTGQNRGEMLGGGGGRGGRYCYVRAIWVGDPVNVRGFKWYGLK